jgi:cytoskeleton protein RodZ
MIENDSAAAAGLTAPQSAPASSAISPGAGGGALLRNYRESVGLHIVALASALKVTRAKLEALENDRYEELPDIVFARALAMSCCRYLGRDPETVLGLMPGHDAQPAPGMRQHQLGTGLTNRPSFGPSRGPFASQKVPPWVLWAFVLTVIVVGGWFAAAPQRTAVRAPAPPLDFPPPGADVTPGQPGVVPPDTGVSAASPAGFAAPNASIGAAQSAVVPATNNAVAPAPSVPAPAPVTPGLRLEPVTPVRP